MLYGVKFYNEENEGTLRPTRFDTLRNTGFFLLDDVNISAPVLKTKCVDIPGADGTLDFSDAIGDVCYENRKISFTLGSHTDKIHEFEMDRQRLASIINGKKLRVILPMDYELYPRRVPIYDTDPVTGEREYTGKDNWLKRYIFCSCTELRYWYGRVSIGAVDYTKKNVNIIVDAFPYKYEWREIKNTFTVGNSGEYEFSLSGSQKVTVPEFTFSDDVNIEFTPFGSDSSVNVSASAGTYKFPDIRLTRVSDYGQLHHIWDSHNSLQDKDPYGHPGASTFGRVYDHIKFTADEGTEISYRYKRMWL